jgi:hypothetical protein
MADSTPAPPEQGRDKRAPRRRVLLTGLVVSPELDISFRALIRDRSEAGAKLKLPDATPVPHWFWLIDVTEGVAYRATAVWRRYPEIGVSLTEPMSLHVPGPDLQQRRLRSLWIEIAPRR